MSSTISKMNQYKILNNNNSANSYLQMKLKSEKETRESEAQELKIEDLKLIDIDTELDYLYEIVYKTYKKEFTKDKSFSIDSDDEITEEVDTLLNEFEERMKMRNQNLSDSLLSEFLDDLDFTQSVAPNSARVREKNRSAKKNNNAEGKSVSANTGYGNSKYSKKGNQHVLNSINNNNNNLNANIVKKCEINVEFSEEEDFAYQNNNNNITNNSNNNLDFVKRSDSNLSEITKNDNFIQSSNIASYINQNKHQRNSTFSNNDNNNNNLNNLNNNNLDSELMLEISDSKRNQNESYLEKNLQTEDFNLSYSEVNIKQNVSRLSKQMDNSVLGSNDVSLSHQSVFRNSMMSRNPSFVMNKFQFFSNDDNDIDNFNFKHKIPAADGGLMRSSLGQSQNDLQKLTKSHKDLEAIKKSGLPHQNSNSLLARGNSSNNNNNNNFLNKSIEFGKAEATTDNSNNFNFNVNKSISTSKLNLLSATSINNNSNNFSINNSNNPNNNIGSASTEKNNNNSKKEYTFNNTNLNKFINNPVSNNNNSVNNKNNNDKKIINFNIQQNANQGFMPTLDDLMAEINQQNEKSANNQNANFNMKSFEKSNEPSSANSHYQKFPSDNSMYSQKFHSLSKNLSNSLSQEDIILNKNALIESYFERIINFKQINIKNYYFEAKINYYDLNTDDPFLENFITVLEKNNFMNETRIKLILQNYQNRYEINFFDLIHKYLDLKKQIFTNLNQKNILLLKNQIIEAITETNIKIEKQSLLLNNNFNNISNNLGPSANQNNNYNNSEFFIFKPILLLKFWDNSTEENYLQSYMELNKLFLIKTLLKTNETVKAYKELSPVLDDENLYLNSHLLLYYFGKVISQLIQKIEKGQIANEPKVLEFLHKDKIDNYNKIKRILREFGQPNSYNYKKRAKNYENLAIISVYFGIDQKKIEIFNKRAKKYMEYYNDPSKITLTKENKTGRDSAGSL